ncbi:MAG TPA: methylenetetrahydrofolate reductase [NAD(P)H] [Pirellulaceae bacterium]|nr:methylenetetrahydrofolate reductase [NAD(P)H] [Pirellulaceae bacterium]
MMAFQTAQRHYRSGRLTISFELFPPKTLAGQEKLDEQVELLVQMDPDFITCTYGAGGSSQAKTLEIVTRIKKRFGLPVASHLTVVGRSIEELRDYLQQASTQGIDDIVALRGDPPQGTTGFQPVAGGLQYANELVAMIRREFPNFGVFVAGYPETHREAPDPQSDLLNLKRKVEAGADAIITQLFYNNEDYFRFCERCRAIGISCPIVPGLLPITNLQQIHRLTSMCGAKLPRPLEQRLAERDDPAWQFEVGIEWAVEQTRELIDCGVPGLHFYVLNQSMATMRIVQETEIVTLRRN